MIEDPRADALEADAEPYQNDEDLATDPEA
jgi:hypothetical protein